MIKPSAGRGSCRKSCKDSDGYLIECIQPSLRKARALMPLCGYWQTERDLGYVHTGEHPIVIAGTATIGKCAERRRRADASWEPNTILHYAFGGCRCAESRLRGRQGSELEAKSDCGSIAANVSERHLFLLPVRWPRPSPSNKRVSQSRLLTRRFRRTIHGLPRKSRSAKSYSSTAAYRRMEP